MGQVARAAKSARSNFSAKTLAALADACVADAKDVKALLDALSRSGIQDSDRFNRQIDDLLKDLRDVLP